MPGHEDASSHVLIEKHPRWMYVPPTSCWSARTKMDSIFKKERGGRDSQSKLCMRRENVTREGNKFMHGIADPLTRLCLAITSSQASVRAEGGGRGGRGGGPGSLTRRTRLCKGSHVRRLLTERALGRHQAASQPQPAAWSRTSELNRAAVMLCVFWCSV